MLVRRKSSLQSEFLIVSLGDSTKQVEYKRHASLAEHAEHAEHANSLLQNNNSRV